MRFPPEVYLIGAQKAGTTTLANLLDQHPGIVLSSPKEAAFFTQHWGNGLDWYAGSFDGPDDAILIDATPSYTTAPIFQEGVAGASPYRGVPERIHSVRPDAKFIYILRDPVERAYSSYWHAVRAGNESRSLEKAFEPKSVYFRGSCYYQQIHLYYEYFDPKSFLILEFQDLCRDPIGVAQKCATFLNATPTDFSFVPVGAKNQSFQYSSAGRRVQTMLGGSSSMKRFTKIAKTMVPKRFHTALKRKLTQEIPKITDKQRDMMNLVFEREGVVQKPIVGFQIK